MRLLKVTQAYYPFLEKGGPTVKVRSLARGLAAKGHGVTVLTADLGLDEQRRRTIHAAPNRWGYESREDGVDTVYFRTRARYRMLTWNPGVSNYCREHLAGFDITHIYGLYDFLGPQVARACRKLKRPYVLEPMGMFRPIIRKIRLKRFYHSVIGGSMIRGASRLIATSALERDELVKEGIPSGKILIRRNGIDVPETLPPAGEFRNARGIPKDAKLVLFLGRLISKKSPDLMLEAYARWRRAHVQPRGSVLVMAGPDEGDGYRQRLEAIAAQSGLNGGVLFPGPLYDEFKWAAYRDADVFVLPSQNENFGNTAAEAVACGTPVLVTDRCGIAPLVDRRAGLAVPHDSAAIEAGLEKILGDAAYAAQLRRGCSEVARSLTWTEPLAEMESIYQNVLLENHAQ